MYLNFLVARTYFRIFRLGSIFPTTRKCLLYVFNQRDGSHAISVFQVIVGSHNQCDVN